MLIENLCYAADKSDGSYERRRNTRLVCAPSNALCPHKQEALFFCGVTAEAKNQQFPCRQIQTGRKSFVNNGFSVVFIGRRCKPVSVFAFRNSRKVKDYSR